MLHAGTGINRQTGRKHEGHLLRCHAAAAALHLLCRLQRLPEEPQHFTDQDGGTPGRPLPGSAPQGSLRSCAARCAGNSCNRAAQCMQHRTNIHIIMMCQAVVLMTAEPPYTIYVVQRTWLALHDALKCVLCEGKVTLSVEHAEAVLEWVLLAENYKLPNLQARQVQTAFLAIQRSKCACTGLFTSRCPCLRNH